MASVRRSRAIKGFVSSLVSAELFVKNHKDEARTIVARKLGVSDFDSLWKGTLFEVGLDHPLIVTMEAQMRWMQPRDCDKGIRYAGFTGFCLF